MPNTGFAVYAEDTAVKMLGFILKDMEASGLLPPDALVLPTPTAKNPDTKWHIPHGQDEEYLYKNKMHSLVIDFSSAHAAHAFENAITPALTSHAIVVSQDQRNKVLLTAKSYTEILNGLQDYIGNNNSIASVLENSVQHIAAAIAGETNKELLNRLEIKAQTTEERRAPVITVLPLADSAAGLAEEIKTAITAPAYNRYLGIALRDDGAIHAHAVPQMMQSLNNALRNHGLKMVPCPETFNISAVRA